MGTQEIPTLMTILFGEKAPLMLEEASPRLLCWCQIFEDWLEERRRRCLASTLRKSIAIWKRALRKIGKYPWEISQADVRAYIAWRQEQEATPNTITFELGVISSFYKWCRQEQIGNKNGEILNPTEGVRRPHVRKYANAKVLNLEEARALLAVLRMDEAILTKRDYAFFLARLRLGVAHKKLRQLQWGQIENDEDGAWVNWGGGGQETRGGYKTTRLPEDVYQAIVDYLRAAGRLEGMRPEAYIFAPLADPLRQEASGRAEEWDDGRHLGSRPIWETLKRYGRLAGIADEKLTMNALRHTAALLRLEAGDSPEEIQEFLHRPQLEEAKKYLVALPPPNLNMKGLRDLEKDPPQYPERKPGRNKPWGGMRHGMRARSQPPEEVAAVLAEEIQGMEEETTNLRILHRSLLEMLNWTSDPLEEALLIETYSRSAVRLSQLIKVEEEMNKKSRQQREDWAEQLLANLARSARERGEELDIEQVKALAWGGEGMMAANAQRLAEEIAGMRVALRRTFQQAMESGGVHQRAYLTDVYGRGCRRLARLLSLEGEDHTRLQIYLKKLINDVILELQEEWGLK